jgi:transcription factor IIIB 90 kDa subunit
VTAAESVKNLIQKNARYSKRINYDALRDLFEGGRQDTPGGATPEEKLDLDADLYTIDADKADDEDIGAVVIEEGGGGVGMAKAPGSAKKDAAEEEAGGDEDAIGDADEDAYGYVSEKGEEYGEWDAYEQEV